MSRTDHARRPVDKRRAKALAILREQRLRIVAALAPEGSTVPDTIIARVRGHMGLYAVDLKAGVWSCTCPDGAQGGCAHAWAVRLVTGHGGAG